MVYLSSSCLFIYLYVYLSIFVSVSIYLLTYLSSIHVSVIYRYLFIIYLLSIYHLSIYYLSTICLSTIYHLSIISSTYAAIPSKEVAFLVTSLLHHSSCCLASLFLFGSQLHTQLYASSTKSHNYWDSTVSPKVSQSLIWKYLFWFPRNRGPLLKVKSRCLSSVVNYRRKDSGEEEACLQVEEARPRVAVAEPSLLSESLWCKIKCHC